MMAKIEVPTKEKKITHTHTQPKKKKKGTTDTHRPQSELDVPLDNLLAIHHDYGKKCYLPANKTQQ